nr:DUF5683 domain-containing protein [uncultured Arsenicibacter sp.]
MKYRGVWVWMVLLLATSAVQAQKKAVADSVRVGNSVLTADDSTVVNATDTVRISEKKTAEIRKIIPRQATIRSAILPGLGQIYNGQPWKVPFVYAALGTEVYLIVDFNKKYLQFESAYRTAYEDKSTGENAKTAVVRIKRDGQWQDVRFGVAQLKTITDIYHRYRDLNVILMAAFWGLNAVEANVAAHLKTFDMSDDLSMQVKPMLIPNLAGGPPILGAKLTLTIK